MDCLKLRVNGYTHLKINIYLFIKTSFAWVTKLSVNTVFQFGPGVKHNTSKKVQYIRNIQIADTEERHNLDELKELDQLGEYWIIYKNLKTKAGNIALQTIVGWQHL